MFKIILVVLIVLAVPNISKSASLCSPSGMKFDIVRSDANDSDWKIFDQFYSAAKINNKGKIIQTFSNLDGSRDKIADQLTRIDKFKRWKETRFTEFDDSVFHWGNYRFRSATFLYKNREVEFDQAILCVNGDCAMSAILEPSSRDSEFANTFVGVAKKGVECTKNNDSEEALKLSFSSEGYSSKDGSEAIVVKIDESIFEAVQDITPYYEYLESCASKIENCKLGKVALSVPVLRAEAKKIESITISSTFILDTREQLKRQNSVYRYVYQDHGSILIYIVENAGDRYLVALPFNNDSDFNPKLFRTAEFGVLSSNEMAKKLILKR